MNQRVNELINQATRTCMEFDPAHAVPAPNLRFNMILIELIVKECIGEAYPDNFKVDGVEPHNLADAVSRIKQHFGVEE